MTTASDLHGKFFVVDTFTSQPLTGNPAAVLFMRDEASCYTDKQFIRLAQDIASVEVAVVLPPDSDSKADFKLRFFTKNTETPFCGHATLAAAHAIIQNVTAFNNAQEVTFRMAKMGPTPVAVKRSQNDNSKLELNVKPTLPTRKEMSEDDTRRLAECLSLTPDCIRAVFAHTSGKNLIVALSSVQDVVNAKTNRNVVLDFLGKDFAKLMITAVMPDNNNPLPRNIKQFKGNDFVSRLFAPKIGIDEDACSAASTCILAKLWATVLEQKRFAGRPRLFAHQASPRGGDMALSFYNKEGKVGVAGGAVCVVKGKLNFEKSNLKSKL